MPAVKLERATEADAAAIAALRLAAARELGVRFGAGPWSRASDTVDGVRCEVRGGTVWIARGAAGPVATLRLLDASPWLGEIDFFTPAERAVYLTTMAVAPAQQRRGVGRGCLAAVERLARAWGADAVRLDSFDGPAGAAGFYERCGFRPVKRGEYLGARLVWLERQLEKERGALRGAPREGRRVGA